MAKLVFVIMTADEDQVMVKVIRIGTNQILIVDNKTKILELVVVV
jgi:hypothetical protein